ncbi:MAG: sigma-70 family RNA polymerase sigma factor [Terracidiphilus sp.]|jgi:RNA polymerase sigma-70 factor (ECF subfamily)
MGLAWPANHPSDKDLSLGTPAKPLRRDLELPATGARRPRQIPDGKELVQGRFQAGLAVHPTDQDLPVGVPAVAPAARPVCREAASLEIDWSQVVSRCMDGDSSAWAELVRAQHRRVYGLCYRFTGNPADAEDLTQDVFLKIYSNLASFDMGRGSLQVWITSLTRNLLVDNFRRTRNQRATSSLDDGWESAEELKPIDRLTARGVSPHESAASKELAKMVQEALARVSVDLREAVILRDLQDLDYKEIAQVLGIPEGTVKSRISRGRAELARLLERNRREVM